MEKLQLRVGGMFCSFCAESIEKALGSMEGVADVRVSLAHEEVLVHYNPEEVKEAELKKVLRQLGYTIRDPGKVRSYEEEEAELRRERHRLIISGCFAMLAALLMLVMWLGIRREWFPYAMLALAIANVFGAGGYILKMALHSLRRGILNQHVLLELAAFSGLAGGFAGFFVEGFPIADFFGVAVFVTTYHILSGYASLLVRTRASQAVRRLLAMQPATVRVVRDGEEEEIPVEKVKKGELVRILPGESIPVDGVVVEGISSVDESLVTGESMPVEKQPGAEVIGGSVNLTGSVVVRVTRVGEESFLQQVARHIEEARALKPGVVQLVDRILKYYVPGVIVFALFGFTAWTLGAWIITGEMSIKRGAFAMLAALVMGYPCALGMATPLAIIRGSGEAASRGILLRSPQAFQALKDAKYVVFDKTGTLTKGRPEVTDVVAFDMPEEELLKLAASAELRSEHPLAQAIVRHAREQGLYTVEVSNFEAVPGSGVRARLGGRSIVVGSLRFLKKEGVDGNRAEGQALTLEREGKSVVGVASDGRLLGIIALADVLKDDAAEAVNQLRELGMRVAMITGDNRRTAEAIAKKLGIDVVLAEVLPQDKANEVKRLQEQGEVVAFVGDGINDAPALAQADVGIAIGSGTDIAIESGEIVLIKDDLRDVVAAIQLSQKTLSKIKQNIFWALFYNSMLIPLAAGVGYVAFGIVFRPEWAAAAMALSSVSVVSNSLLMKNYVPEIKRQSA